ncbi:helix-turn-helix domain-containing protein [Niveispirillum sp. SYP-B3756]|uniref:AraC family transcriptional regulator n=1 Tax=Niveispirillum sp. SYP-B3756 TaxID=2662178 RepID=UPI0012918164|nr:AraC family transcriptional regulator [Niveispirillum sp. SYP-B3756]MQP68625.1 helix-turn-helix domain-containing protein [Niveispirillum sp. SYP-B3756]
MDKDSVSIHFVRGIADCIAAKGVAVEPLLRKAGIDPALLVDPAARVPVSAYGILLREVAQLLDDEFFGMDRRRMKLGSFSMLCLLAVGARNLGRALQRLTHGYRALFDDVHVALCHGDGMAWLEVRPLDPARPLPVFAYETLLVYIHGVACWLVRQRIPILAADFAFPEPPQVDEYFLLYSSTLRFNQTATRLWFDAKLLSLPVQQDERSARLFLNQAPDSFLVKFKNPDSYSQRVRSLLRQCPPAEWLDFDAVAQQLRCSPATLRRGLRQEGRPFQAMKDQLRQEMAMAALADPAQSVAEVAAMLGFADPSAFQRAFRKWSGLAPGAWRAQHRH